jgi:hypothetical protein
MKPYAFPSLVAGALAALGLLAAAAGAASPAPSEPGTPQYDAEGRLVPPADYREWVFLSSGVDMSYSQAAAAAAPDHHMFDNVFAPRAAYAAFMKTGVWPDKTVLMLEVRGGASKGSINKRGQFQDGEIMGLEAHVKDTARFKGGWGFFGLDDGKPAKQIAYTAGCYSCHQAHAAADTTFVQFYPTLLPVATKLGTLNPAYVKDEAAAASAP